MLGPSCGKDVGDLAAQIGPVGQGKAREQTALADPEDGDGTPGDAGLPADRVDQVLDRDLDVGGGEVREVDVADRMAKGFEGAFADQIPLLARGAGTGDEEQGLRRRAFNRSVSVEGRFEFGVGDRDRGLPEQMTLGRGQAPAKGEDPKHGQCREKGDLGTGDEVHALGNRSQFTRWRTLSLHPGSVAQGSREPRPATHR